MVGWLDTNKHYFDTESRRWKRKPELKKTQPKERDNAEPVIVRAVRT